MTGIYTASRTISQTGNQLIDGTLSEYAWSGSAVTYAFPTSSASYAYSYSSEPDNNFGAISAAQKTAALFAMEKSFGSTANDGFSVEGFTNLGFSTGTTTRATVRFAQSSDPSTAYAYLPGSYDAAGDIWFGSGSYRSPVAGNYQWHTLIHELGHALGLEHGHDSGKPFGPLPAEYDSLEYSVMTYHGYIGDTEGAYSYEEYGAPQTFMISDIAALQHMYGADYSTNSGNTVYKWTPTSGKTFVNGVAAIEPGANRIFATIWDGGGSDTFDLTAYKTALKIDLRPGKYSLFSEDQSAFLGGGPNDGLARGNIFNALLYQGNTASLIEHVKGGSASDQIIGNQVNNALRGYGGNDALSGDAGNDTLNGGTGSDRLNGGTGADTASYLSAAKEVLADLANASRNLNDAKGDTYLGIENLTGSSYADRLYGDTGVNMLSGAEGNDYLSGSSGNDRLYGGAGADDLIGGSGADTFIFRATAESTISSTGRDTIFDFSAAQGDRIDVAAMDANTRISGNQAFSFIGSAAFSGKGGELRVTKSASDTYVYGDINGDKTADFAIHLDDAITMQGSYFVL